MCDESLAPLTPEAIITMGRVLRHYNGWEDGLDDRCESGQSDRHVRDGTDI